MVPADQSLSFERVVEELRTRHGALHDDLIAALAMESATETAALIDAGTEGIVVQQGRARHAVEMLKRAQQARQALEEHGQRIIAAQRRKGTP